LWFNEKDYKKLGNMIKWNPAIKSPEDKAAILDGLINNYIDVLATDHSPHTIKEKSNNYMNCPSGGPLIQHSLPALLEMYHNNKIDLETIVQKTSHNPAILFDIKERGFIREGYFADLVLFDLDNTWKVSKNKIFSKCNWTPFINESFRSKIIHTIVSGNHVYNNGDIKLNPTSLRLEFDRD
jgi:dihydroorotase